jgi:hypothetical protein
LAQLLKEGRRAQADAHSTTTRRADAASAPDRRSAAVGTATGAADGAYAGRSTAAAVRKEPMRAFGVILIIIGIIALAYGGISWTDRDTIVDAGPLEIQTEDREGIPLPPIVGIISVAAGLVLVFAGGRRRSGV